MFIKMFPPLLWVHDQNLGKKKKITIINTKIK